jgi:predicted transcriptional regulator
MSTVAEIIKQKPVAFNTIAPTAMVIEALQLMNTVNLSYLVVKNEDAYCGIFSERDYSRNVILKGLHSDSCTVQEVMSTNLPLVDVNDTLETCMYMLNTHKTRYVLAYNETTFVAVVTINDVLRAAIANKEMVLDAGAVQAATEMQDKIY